MDVHEAILPTLLEADTTALTSLGSVAQIPEGHGRAFDVSGHKIAVFNVGGRYYAIGNECPHKGGPLAQGFLEGTVVTCPWHGWEICLVSGVVQHAPGTGAKCYGLRIENGEIFIELKSAE